MTVVARYPDSTKTSLEQRLRARARERWPQIASLQIRHRGNFSYVDATLTDATTLKLCRLRYVGSAHDWQFAIYRASHDDYDESVFFTGLPVGTCQDALDTACGLYLNDPTAWTRPPTNLRARPLSEKLHPEELSVILYTSGTTGRPKGVPRAHGAEHAAAVAHVIQTQHRPGEVTLGVMPLFHTMGVRTLLASILVAGTWVPQAGFDADTSLELIARDRVSALYLVPAIYWSLLRTGRLAEAAAAVTGSPTRAPR